MTMAVMVVFGIGRGFNVQPLTLAAQDAAPRHQLGVATSTATFSRQIGGTIGTAVFHSVLFSTMPDKISAAFRSIAPTPDFQAALRDPPTRPSPRFADSRDVVFLLGSAVMVVGFLVMLLLPHVELQGGPARHRSAPE